MLFVATGMKYMPEALQTASRAVRAATGTEEKIRQFSTLAFNLYSDPENDWTRVSRRHLGGFQAFSLPLTTGENVLDEIKTFVEDRDAKGLREFLKEEEEDISSLAMLSLSTKDRRRFPTPPKAIEYLLSGGDKFYYRLSNEQKEILVQALEDSKAPDGFRGNPMYGALAYDYLTKNGNTELLEWIDMNDPEACALPRHVRVISDDDTPQKFARAQKLPDHVCEFLRRAEVRCCYG